MKKAKNKRKIIEIDSKYYRPTEVESLLGDSSKAKSILGWEPKISFQELVSEMTKKDLEIAMRDEVIKDHGYDVMNHHE